MADREEEINSEKLLTNETEQTPIEDIDKENMPLLIEEEDDFKGYSKI